MEQRDDASESRDAEDGRAPTEDLIRRAQAGDDAALNDLFATHYDQLRSFVRSKLGPKLRRGIDDSQDVLHSAFRGALRSFSDFEPQGDEAWIRWLGTVIANTIANKARHQDAQKRGRGNRGIGGTEGLGLIDAQDDEGRSPSATAEVREEEDLLYDALELLPPERRELLVMAHIRKLPLEEIAAALGCTEGAARQRIYRAEDALKSAFKRMKRDR